MRLKNIINAVCISALLLNLSKYAYAVPGDFDGDGTSDLSVALVDRAAKSTAWLTRPSNGLTPKFWTFNVPADALVSMRYFAGDSRYYPGIVSVKDSKLPLEWYVKNSSNGTVSFKWGLPGDIIPNQADIDCDGREDPLVVRNIGGVLNWYFARTATNTMFQTVFGIAGDQVGMSDTKGDCTADMIALRNGFNWYVRDPVSLGFSTVQWGLNGDIPMLPTDIDSDGLPDYVISRRSSAGQVAYIKFGNGQTRNVNLGQNTSIPQVGSFGPGSKFAWSQRDTGWTAISNENGSANVFRFGISSNAIVRADGTVVQPSSDSTFGGVSVPPQVPQSGSGATFGSCQQILDVSDGKIFIYKNSAPIRNAAGNISGYRIQPTLIMNRNISSKGNSIVYDSKGSEIGRCPWASANGHAGGRYRCTMPTSSLRNSAINNTGNPKILFKINSSQCVSVPDAGKCYGSVKGLC